MCVLKDFFFLFCDFRFTFESKAQFHSLSLVPIQNKKKKKHFLNSGVLINKVLQGSQKNKKYL
jgi:hypothetical protein